jgi:hypothetical protein
VTEIDKQAVVAKIANLPRMTINAHPLFLFILAISLPDIVSGDDAGEWAPMLRREALALIDEVFSKLPPEAAFLREDKK